MFTTCELNQGHHNCTSIKSVSFCDCLISSYFQKYCSACQDWPRLDKIEGHRKSLCCMQTEETVISGTVVSVGRIMPAFEPKYFQHPREIVFNILYVYKSLLERSFNTHLKHGTQVYYKAEELHQNSTSHRSVCNSQIAQHSIYQFISLLHPHKLFLLKLS